MRMPTAILCLAFGGEPDATPPIPAAPRPASETFLVGSIRSAPAEHAGDNPDRAFALHLVRWPAEEDRTWRRLIRSLRSSATIALSRRCSATVFVPAASTSRRTRSA